MYRPLPDGVTIKESEVQGLGLFATKDFEADIVLGIVHIMNKNFPHGSIRTALGAFYNHHDDPNCKNIKGFIFGNNHKKFSQDLKNKIKIKKFTNLKKTLNELFKDIKKDNSSHKTILFSPAAASFDQFINFEKRGDEFKKLSKLYARKFI